MSAENLFYEKEISWLSFNERVLQEAADKTVPVVERVRFLGIFSNNLDEFFRVRVADVKRRVLIEKEQEGEEKKAEKLLNDLQKKVLKLQTDFDRIHKDVVKALARHKITFVTNNNLTEFHDEWVRKFFREQVLRHINPIIVSETSELTKHLSDSTTYLAVDMVKDDTTQFAIVDVPTDTVGRFVLLPAEKSKVKKEVILLDDIICYCLDDIFKGFFDFDSISAYSFKITRDAEYGLIDEIEQSIVEQMSEGVKQRLHSEPTRVVYDRDMPESMLDFISEKLNVKDVEDGLLPGGRYRNFKDFIGFPNAGRAYLENNPLPPMKNKDFTNATTAFEAITKGDILLYYPYHTFDHFTELVRQASFDPAVTSIKLNIYRVAKDSRIIRSLMDAVKNGKNVTVIVELKARFDEENNIEWSKIMTEAGIRVVFGTPTLKIHSKLCLITRREEKESVRYVHIGTGNFHEKTAKIYTDFSLFTRNNELAKEVENVFDFIEHMYKRHKFQHLLVSPVNARSKITRLIDAEIENARAGRTAKITIKVNNLVDNPLILKLYEASQAGVKINMILRGMCTLVPGVKGLSENINIISIVDRFLEHPRVMVFHNDGDTKVFISSADWMTRNIEHRIEVGCPIYDETLKQRIIDILELQMQDTTKARVIDAEQKNDYVKRGNRKKLRSQAEIYDYLKTIESE